MYVVQSPRYSVDALYGSVCASPSVAETTLWLLVYRDLELSRFLESGVLLPLTVGCLASIFSKLDKPDRRRGLSMPSKHKTAGGGNLALRKD